MLFFLYEHACSYNAYDNVSAVGGHVAKSQKDSTKGRSQDIFFFLFIFSGQGSLYTQDPFCVPQDSYNGAVQSDLFLSLFIITGYREHISPL